MLQIGRYASIFQAVFLALTLRHTHQHSTKRRDLSEVMDTETEAGTDDISRRRHERIPTRGKVQACIKSSRDPEHEEKEFQLEILEISPNGLRLRTAEPIQGYALDLLATIDGFPASIFLSTTIRWQEIDDEGYQMLGVEIVNHEASDLDTWCEFQREEWFRGEADSE